MWNALYLARFLDEGVIAPSDDRTDPFTAMTKPPSADCSWAFPISIAGYNLSVWQWAAWLLVPVVIFKNIVREGSSPLPIPFMIEVLKYRSLRDQVNVIQLVAATLDIAANVRPSVPP
jgi:hypothetical protein